MASGAAALLLPDPVLGAVDFTAGEHLVGTGATLGALPFHNALDEIDARLQAVNGIGKLDLTGGLVVEIEDFRFHPFSPPPARLPPLPQVRRCRWPSRPSSLTLATLLLSEAGASRHRAPSPSRLCGPAQRLSP